MKTTREKLWAQANAVTRGSLTHLKTTAGRRKEAADEDVLAMHDPFLSDVSRLTSSKWYRILVDKTQVFTRPSSPLIRSRQAHVQEVAAQGIVVADILGLNTSLALAIGLGHDIGHVPFGHPGEEWMAREMGRPFCHEVMGPVIAQRLERRGTGLNLCWETLDGMMRHSGNMARPDMTPEAWIIRHVDKFAYIFHDFNDIVVRMEFPVKNELRTLANKFGATQRERTNTAMSALLIESASTGKVIFEHSEWARDFAHLRTLMYEVYRAVSQQNVGDVMGPVLDFLKTLNAGDPFLVLASMTDKDVRLMCDADCRNLDAFRRTSVYGLLPYLEQIGTVDLCDPGLGW